VTTVVGRVVSAVADMAIPLCFLRAVLVDLYHIYVLLTNIPEVLLGGSSYTAAIFQAAVGHSINHSIP
jgi:hypothetical protein